MRSNWDENNVFNQFLSPKQLGNMRADSLILDKWSSDHSIETVSKLESTIEELLTQTFYYTERIHVVRNGYEIGNLSSFPPNIQKQFMEKIELAKKKLFDDYLKASTSGSSNQDQSVCFSLPYTNDTCVLAELELKTQSTLVAHYEKRISEIKKYQECLERADSGMGNIVLNQNYIVHQYQDYVKKINVPDFVSKLWGNTRILDIGTATGKNSYPLISFNSVLVANDLSKKDLLSLRARVPKKLLPHLFLNNETFPYEMNQQENSFDAVLLSHVLHYLTPSQMQTGFRKIFSWLKPGGSFFAQALTSYSLPYFWRGHTLQNIAKSTKGSATFISYCRKSSNEASQSFGTLHSLPSTNQSHHPIDHKDLKNELEKAGFEIKLISYSNIFQKEKPTLTCEEVDTYIMSQTVSENALTKIEIKASHSAEMLANLKQTRKNYQISTQSYQSFLRFKVDFERIRDRATTITDASELHQHFSTIWPTLIEQLKRSEHVQQHFAARLGLFANHPELKVLEANATRKQIVIAESYKHQINDTEKFKQFIESEELYKALGICREPLYYFNPATTIIAVAVKPKL